MKKLDEYEKELVNQVLYLSMNGKLEASYIESMPRKQRIHAIKAVESSIEKINKQISNKDEVKFNG